jgi:hypothetical protein
VANEPVKEVGGQIPNVSEVAMSETPLLFRSEKLNKHLGLPSGQLVDRVAMCRKVDDTRFLDTVAVLDTNRSHGPERSFKSTRPVRGRLGMSDQGLTQRSLFAFTSELKGDLDDPGGVPKDGDRRAGKLRETVDVCEVNGVADGRFARIVGTQQHAEPARERACHIACGPSAETPDRDFAQVHAESTTMDAGK